MSEMELDFIEIKRDECVIPAEFIRMSGICHTPSPVRALNAVFQISGEETSACVPWIIVSSSELGIVGCRVLKDSLRWDVAAARDSGFRPVIWMEWFPVREKAVAIARPMPREPPVIRTRIGRGGAVEWNDLMILLDGRADFEEKERSDPGACILYIVLIILDI